MRLFIILFFTASWICASVQCSEDPDEAILNTQEKYDVFFEKYPYCQEYSVIKYNNRFLGNPDERGYLIALGSALIGIILLTKLVFYFEWRRRPR